MARLRVAAFSPRLLAFTAALFATGAIANTRTYEVSLPAGELKSALVALGRQTQVSLFFAEETVAGIASPAIEGQFVLEDILARLTAGHCLSYEYVRETLVAIAPGCTPAPLPPAPPVAALSREAPPPRALVEELVVRDRYLTGSRLRNANFGRTMPLDVIDQTEIRLSGYQSVSELLRYVPAVSGNSTSTLISNGGDGTATVTLRGLPASNTLVLLNGRRLNADALKGKAVDLNTLPLSLVDQIEILKDGVSAIYGSDAIAGVVNIITKQDIDGVSLDAYSGRSSHGDLETEHLSITAGHIADRWRASLGLSYYDQEGVLSRDRRLSATSDDRRRGGIDKRSSATIPGRISLADDTLILRDGSGGSIPTDFRPAHSEDLFDYRDFTSSIVPSSRTSAFAQFEWQFNTAWRGYFEGMYTHTDSDTRLAPVPLFTGFESIDLVVDADQLYNPFDVAVSDIRRRITELPERRQIDSTYTARGVVGAEYESANLRVNTTLQYNRTSANETFSHGVDVRRLAEALRADCVEPCVPFNLFGPAGSVTPDMLEYVGTDARINGVSRMNAITIDADWRAYSLPAGDLEVSAGLEFRSEELVTRPDEVMREYALVGGGNRGAANGGRDILEAYAEVFVPLLSDRFLIEQLSAQLAFRVSRYSDFGREVVPRLVVNYTPVEGLTLRGSAAGGFRAPTLQQLHGSEVQSFEQLNDPCSVASNVGTLPGCPARSDPALTQFLTVTGGNPSLDPERAWTTSLGGVISHSWGRTDGEFSIDWYHISQDDVVESSAQYILNQNARLNRFEERVSRDDAGNLNRVQATLQNIGNREVAGFDLTASLVREFSRVGLINVAFNATHISSFKDKFDPESPTIQKVGTFTDEASGGLGSLPEWKWNLSIAWQNNHWQAHYNLYRVSSLEELVPLLETTRTIDSWTTQNINLSYLGPASAWFRITAGINNLFDEQPPFSAAAFNDSYDGRTYDITGRYFFVKLDKTI